MKSFIAPKYLPEMHQLLDGVESGNAKLAHLREAGGHAERGWLLPLRPGQLSGISESAEDVLVECCGRAQIAPTLCCGEEVGALLGTGVDSAAGSVVAGYAGSDCAVDGFLRCN